MSKNRRYDETAFVDRAPARREKPARRTIFHYSIGMGIYQHERIRVYGVLEKMGHRKNWFSERRQSHWLVLAGASPNDFDCRTLNLQFAALVVVIGTMRNGDEDDEGLRFIHVCIRSDQPNPRATALIAQAQKSASDRTFFDVTLV